MFDPENDVDWQTLDLEEAARDARNGVCSICTDVLDPLAPKWSREVWPILRLRDDTERRMTAGEYAESLGPVHADLPYHVLCMADRGLA
jgi:hypothetical protein